MSTPSATIGYVICYVKDVAASLDFYERAFGLTRRFFINENGHAYGELETGAARLAFSRLGFLRDKLKLDVAAASPEAAPPGVEIALVTADVAALYARAVQAGAIPVGPPVAEPWGQTVAFVRDNAGHLVSICTAMA